MYKIKSYCLKCRKDTENINPRVSNTSNGRKTSDKFLRDKAFNISKNPKYDGYQRGFPSTVYKFFDKSSKGARSINILLEFNEQLAKELHKPIIKKEQFIQDLKIIFGLLI